MHRPRQWGDHPARRYRPSRTAADGNMDAAAHLAHNTADGDVDPAAHRDRHRHSAAGRDTAHAGSPNRDACPNRNGDSYRHCYTGLPATCRLVNLCCGRRRHTYPAGLPAWDDGRGHRASQLLAVVDYLPRAAPLFAPAACATGTADGDTDPLHAKPASGLGALYDTAWRHTLWPGQRAPDHTDRYPPGQLPEQRPLVCRADTLFAACAADCDADLDAAIYSNHRTHSNGDGDHHPDRANHADADLDGHDRAHHDRNGYSGAD